MGEKQRLDLLLMGRTGYSRGFAQDIIERGVVVNGRRTTKPGEKFHDTAEIVFIHPERVYVSRGGYKLQQGIESFGIDLSGKTCLDAGASAGGFTDCMLQAGAAMVYAVDVGSSQLSERLRTDPRVVSMENTDLRSISPEMFPAIDFLGADLSFISITKVLQAIRAVLAGEGILLIKPQFEAGRRNLNRKGIVTDKKIHQRVIEDVYRACADNGLQAIGHVQSPITGQDGNVEYLMYVR